MRELLRERVLSVLRYVSLIDHGEFNPTDIADRFVDWYHSGPFDIGLMTADALRQLDAGKLWDDAGRTVWEHRSEGQNAGSVETLNQ